MLITLFAAQAFAGADLTPSIAVPTGGYVYDSGRYTVTVSNVGNANAGASSLSIQLPVTNTSPGVYVMGTVGAKSSTCTASGTKLVCSIPSIRRGRTSSVYFDITLPESSAPLTFTATTTLSGDTNANNTTSANASLLNDAISFSSGNVWADHCTGTGLTSYYECTLFPSSISGFGSTLNADFSVTVPADPDYGGTWSRPSADSLFITWTNFGTPVAEFEGYGVSADCWEGITTFPGSPTYVSPYRVCR